MKDELLEHAIALAKIYGHHTAEYKGKYNGRKVYILTYTDGKKHYTGKPIYLIENDEHLLDYFCDRHLEIFKYFYNLQEQQSTS